MKCPTDNTNFIDQTSFWSSGSLHWDHHRIGWAIAGGCTALTVLISIFTVLMHCRNYTNPRHQRQIIRILYMPPVYAIISFLSYRFFRDYTYYSFIEVVYEAITLSAFMLLLIEFVADAKVGETGNRDQILKDKEKRKFVVPFCCFRYRPTKPYFMYTIKWAVLQYVVFRPLVSIVGIVCQALAVLCDSQSFNFRFASVYLEAIDFVSISVALYGLFVFYDLTKEELKGKRPLAKFLCIKLIVMFTFYQSFVFSALQGRVITGTLYWSSTNIADGLNALAICIEMILFAIFMGWAYPYKEYSRPAGTPATRVWRPLWDSINYADFVREIFGSLSYFVNRKKYDTEMADRTRANRPPLPTFASAFSIEDSERERNEKREVNRKRNQAVRSSEDIPLSTHTPSHSQSNGNGNVHHPSSGRDMTTRKPEP